MRVGGGPTRTIILGVSGHAKVVAAILASSSDYTPLGFVDADRMSGSWFGLPILGADAQLPEICKERGVGALAVGIGDNQRRASVVSRVEDQLPGLAWATAAHPDACLSRGSELGAGTVVMANATVGVDSTVDCHVIINTGATVDHDCTISSFASIAPGAVLGGGVSIGRGAIVSIGASVAHGVSIGADTLVGAGAVVLADLPPRVVAYGVPAKIIRARAAGDPYL